MYRVNETWTFFISHIHLYIHDLPKDILWQIIYRGIYIYIKREKKIKKTLVVIDLISHLSK